MIDFIFAAVLYMAIMFVVFFAVSFVTIAIAYGTAMLVRQCTHWFHPAQLALK